MCDYIYNKCCVFYILKYIFPTSLSLCINCGVHVVRHTATRGLQVDVTLLWTVTLNQHPIKKHSNKNFVKCTFIDIQTTHYGYSLMNSCFNTRFANVDNGSDL